MASLKEISSQKYFITHIFQSMPIVTTSSFKVKSIPDLEVFNGVFAEISINI